MPVPSIRGHSTGLAEALALELDLSLHRSQSLQSTLRRGWYWGSEVLKERLMSMDRTTPDRRDRDFRSSQRGKHHAEAVAEAIVRTALREMGLGKRELKSLPGNDSGKAEIAALLQQETTVSQAWIAAHLSMRSAGNVSQQLFRRRKVQIDRR